MFTSDTEQTRRALLKTARNDLLAALLCAVFGAVYEHFSFGVYSPYMVYAFAAPLLLGVLPFLLLAMRERPVLPPRLAGTLWHAGIAALTAGAVFRGILDIYGTASALTRIYWIAGIVLLAAALSVWCTLRLRAKEHPPMGGGVRYSHSGRE